MPYLSGSALGTINVLPEQIKIFRNSCKLLLAHTVTEFLLLYKRLDNGCFRWPRNETEARLLTEQEIRWLLEGLEIEQPKAIRESKPGVLY